MRNKTSRGLAEAGMPQQSLQGSVERPAGCETVLLGSIPAPSPSGRPSAVQNRSCDFVTASPAKSYCVSRSRPKRSARLKAS
jgi:hypothetical protein